MASHLPPSQREPCSPRRVAVLTILFVCLTCSAIFNVVIWGKFRPPPFVPHNTFQGNLGSDEAIQSALEAYSSHERGRFRGIYFSGLAYQVEWARTKGRAWTERQILQLLGKPDRQDRISPGVWIYVFEVRGHLGYYTVYIEPDKTCSMVVGPNDASAEDFEQFVPFTQAVGASTQAATGPAAVRTGRE